MIVFTWSAENLHLLLATRAQALAMVMVWAAITADGLSTFVFIERGVKINAEFYWTLDIPTRVSTLHPGLLKK